MIWGYHYFWKHPCGMVQIQKQVAPRDVAGILTAQMIANCCFGVRHKYHRAMRYGIVKVWKPFSVWKVWKVKPPVVQHSCYWWITTAETRWTWLPHQNVTWLGHVQRLSRKFSALHLPGAVWNAKYGDFAWWLMVMLLCDYHGNLRYPPKATFTPNK